MRRDLRPLLAPRSICVFGASADPTRVGGIPLKLLGESGFKTVYPINAKYDRVGDFVCYPDLASVPEVPELAVLAIGAGQVLSVLETCAAAGIKAAIVFASGFAEATEGDGAARQDAIAHFARRTGMLVAGPNCMGFVNYKDRVFTTFGTLFDTAAPAGSTAIVTQSGNVCATIYRSSANVGARFSHIVNTGNEVDVEFSEYLDFMVDDSDTRTIVGYVESLRDGPHFLHAARKARQAGKLIALLKVGNSEKAVEASRSHTAALTGDRHVYHAAFKAGGVAWAKDLAHLVDLGYIHATAPSRTAGERLAIITLSGAAGAIISDAVDAAGLQVPTLADSVQDTLRSLVPEYGMVANPVDVTGNIVNMPGGIVGILKPLAQSPEIDVIVIYMTGYLLRRTAVDIARFSKTTDKLIVTIDTGDSGCRAQLQDAGVCYFEDITRAVQALGTYVDWFQGSSVEQTSQIPVDTSPALSVDYDEVGAKRLLASAGLPTETGSLATDEDEAAANAVRLGFPVVMKVVSPDILHKTEVGGVMLGISDEKMARDAYHTIQHNVGKHSPSARIVGVSVERQLSQGVELMLNATRDPTFGWVLSVGHGGTLTELLNDISRRLAPVDHVRAQEMLRELRCFPLMQGYRGALASDVSAACDAIVALSTFVTAGASGIDEIEINPLIVMPEGRGAAAVDAVIRKTSAARSLDAAE
jgi:acyl-CoA synthetase (NDP forming)